jgi:dTDP-4-amino-4,6-dideoxygalactose transaminase
MNDSIKVPYLELVRQFSDPNFRREITRVFDHCQFVLGPVVEEFEKRFAEFCRTRFALGVNSGTDAIFIALKALCVGPDDEVITVANSFIATAGAIAATGAQPVFVDVNPDYNMDSLALESAISQKTRAIVPVHLTGCPAPMDAIMNIAEKHGLYVVEDAAQAVGASIGTRMTGAFGHAGCFSLHPLKNLNVAGDGGMITTDSEELYLKLKQLRNHGLKNRNEIECFGFNSRLDSIQAAVGLYNIELIEDVTRRRIENAGRYDRNLADLAPYVVIPSRSAGVRQVFHTYVVQVEDRTNLIAALNLAGIETKIHYPVPIHLQAPCREMGWKRGDLPVTEAQTKKIISLPIHQFLSEEQIDYTGKTIRNFYKKQERA